MRSDRLTTRKALILAATGVLVGSFIFGASLVSGQDKQNSFIKAYNQKNLIRFHVIGNSDSVDDQALKRRVRDIVVEYMTPKFEQGKNVNDARNIAVANLKTMEQLAQKEVIRWGKDYKVKAVIGKFSFPEKTYGNVTLPGGEYEAVRIILGKGAGKNWWCVLFPPLCFIDGSNEMPSETLPLETGEAQTVQAKVYDTVSGSVYEQPETEVRVKFKMVELLQKEINEVKNADWNFLD